MSSPSLLPFYLWQAEELALESEWENWLCPSLAATLGRISPVPCLSIMVELTLVAGVVDDHLKSVSLRQLAQPLPAEALRRVYPVPCLGNTVEVTLITWMLGA